MAMFKPSPRRSAIHAVLFKDTSGNVGHDLTKVLHLLGAEIGGGRRSLLELVLHGNFARIFYSERISEVCNRKTIAKIRFLPSNYLLISD